MNNNIDYSLYLVTDQGLCLGRNLVDVVRGAVAGGVNIVQIREKDSDTRDFLHLAEAMKRALQYSHVPLIINDRVDVALACQADGVHVGQSDLPCAVVREMIGPDKILGVSINTCEQIREALQSDVDYLSLSPVFPTPTKADTTEPFGIEGLARARGMTDRPLITIGGINKSNLREIISTGIDGIAVVSAICSAPSPETAARELADIIRESRAAP
ncbi:MAG: thiamine phosphate synthase [Desulfonatronovibrio sp.]